MSKFAVYEDGDAEKSHTKVSRPSVHGNPQRSIVGKSFNQSTFSGVRRKALGDVNSNCNRLSESNKARDLKKPVPVKTKCFHSEKTSTKKVVQNTAIANVSELKQKENKQEMYEEIECMHPYNEEKEDDFEDLFPKAERPSTYIKDFFEWRPQSVFSSHDGFSRRKSEYDPCKELEKEEEPVREVSACDLLEELPTEEIPDDLFFGQF